MEIVAKRIAPEGAPIRLVPQAEKLKLIRSKQGDGFLSGLSYEELKQFWIIELPNGDVEGFKKFDTPYGSE